MIPVKNHGGMMHEAVTHEVADIGGPQDDAVRMVLCIDMKVGRKRVKIIPRLCLIEQPYKFRLDPQLAAYCITAGDLVVLADDLMTAGCNNIIPLIEGQQRGQYVDTLYGIAMGIVLPQRIMGGFPHPVPEAQIQNEHYWNNHVGRKPLVGGQNQVAGHHADHRIIEGQQAGLPLFHKKHGAVGVQDVEQGMGQAADKGPQEHLENRHVRKHHEEPPSHQKGQHRQSRHRMSDATMVLQINHVIGYEADDSINIRNHGT